MAVVGAGAAGAADSDAAWAARASGVNRSGEEIGWVGAASKNIVLAMGARWFGSHGLCAWFALPGTWFPVW
jgi:hypothetical protein